MNVSIPTGRFGCPQCTQRFETLGSKKRHLRTDHPKTKKDS